MKNLQLYIILLFTTSLFSQTKVGGKVIDEFNEPIAFANVFFKNSIEGVITDENGNFYFEGKKRLPYFSGFFRRF